MTELEWIETYIVPRTRSDDVTSWLGPGDDAALVPGHSGEYGVLTVDALVEGQHFQHPWLDDAGLARRLLRSSVSDLTAMGARPGGVLLSIETPDLPGRVGDCFWRSIDRECQLLEVNLLGGNVTRTSGPLALHATCYGTVQIGREWRRSGASEDDLLLVTGNPGLAAQARQQIEEGHDFDGDDRWTAPEPRISFARAFSDRIARESTQQLPVAIDISDGLLLDLQRICQTNQLGAVIDIVDLTGKPDSPSANQVLSGGEDYELLLAIRPAIRRWVQDAAEQTGTELHEIGILTRHESAEVEVFNDGQRWNPENPGWDPFRKNSTD